jgi:hypothetical protein
VGPKASLDAVEKRKILSLPGMESLPVAIPTELCCDPNYALKRMSCFHVSGRNDRKPFFLIGIVGVGVQLVSTLHCGH